ncbi:hypothetical protein, partial [Sansalvadorimonas verongulae]|uniref:hypothetical protein n=1 Tax=Sansalvadorimonas verongulae TaxID=2172824 RepID=UPI0018AD0F8D
YQKLDALQGSDTCQVRAAEVRNDSKEVDILDSAHGSSTFGWLRSLYSFAPDTEGKSYPELAQLAINRYYCMPHQNWAERYAMGSNEVPTLFRKDHGVDHVTRTQILSEALLELFPKHDQTYKELLNNNPGLKELIPLAMVYHDVTAEAEDKSLEELHAAEIFERDMIASG